MDTKEFELHLEEQRSILKGIDASLGALKDALAQTLEVVEKNPVKEMTVSGEVQVNTEKSVEVTNLEIIAEAVKLLSEQTTKAIQDTYEPAPREITVKNIADAQVREVTIKNIATFGEQAAKLVEAAVQKYQPIIKVEKQEIVFPRAAKDAIPVRLSDGKSFYNAIFSAVSAGVNTDGIIDAINNSSSSTSGISAYTLIQDEETATYEYYGYVKADGSWCIKRVTISTAYSQYVIGASDYATAWTNRASQTYDDYWDVF